MKVGDRVRIDCPYSKFNGREATIIRVVPNVRNWLGGHKGNVAAGETAYDVDIDGQGCIGETGNKLGYPRYQLRPIQPLGSWDELSQIIGKDIRKPIEVAA